MLKKKNVWNAKDYRNKVKIISYLDNKNKLRFQKKDTWPWKRRTIKNIKKFLIYLNTKEVF